MESAKAGGEGVPMAKKGRARTGGTGEEQQQGQGEEHEEDLIAPLVERLARELLALPDEAWGDDDEEG